MLNNGLLIQIQVCTFTGDVQEINFDKYLVGKLSEHVSDGMELLDDPLYTIRNYSAVTRIKDIFLCLQW